MKSKKSNVIHLLRSIFLLSLLSLTVLSTGLSAQNSGILQGVVKDAVTGDPLIGATVQIKGQKTGTVTDFDGKFSLQSATKEGSLVISYIGYLTKEVTIKAKSEIVILLNEDKQELDEVQVVAYGTQNKKTLTGAISSVGTKELVKSPNSSITNSLAGQITGVSTVQTSGQPGKEDPQIFIRGAGSLDDARSIPLILVDGVERSFSQMDPNEIESVTVLKDASATAVFGVRGANGVILVTTRRGETGKTKISFSTSTGAQSPVYLVESMNSYDMALAYNEMDRNDNKPERFNAYSLERYKLQDQPLLYPDINWRDYLMKDYSVQTQNNINISGGSERVKFFTSLGYLYQNGLFKDLGDLPYDANYKYNRYNYRSNLDVEITKTTSIKLNIGGVLGDTYQPIEHTDGMWRQLNWSQPFSSPGIIDGHLMDIDKVISGNMQTKNPLIGYWGKGYKQNLSNSLNMDLVLNQELDFITKGLNFKMKGSYNTDYTFNKTRSYSVETWNPYYQSYIKGVSMDNVLDPTFDKSIVYRITGTNGELGYSEPASGKGRDWYFETSFGYDRNFGDHKINALLLYNQSKTYYPSSFPMNPTGYVGLVTRLNYNYKSKYMAEFNAGYNGSENFAPGLRYGFFPSGSLGWVVTNEDFMKNQNIINYLKVRASVGLVGNDVIGGSRYMYLPDTYNVNQGGYNFGYDIATNYNAAIVKALSNPDVTWETALKKNIGVDFSIIGEKLRFSADIFSENRKDILIKRNTIPGVMGFSVLPPVNLGEVQNRGFELEAKWNQKFHDFRYWINANVSFARNKIIYEDEIPPNEPYQAYTGRSTNGILGYISQGFYSNEDFDDPTSGNVKTGLPVPINPVYPGDSKYLDINEDDIIDVKDQKFIGFPTRPEYVAGLNYGIEYKGFELSMNWTGVTNRSVILSDYFRIPGAGNGVRGIFKYQLDERWTPETAATATAPRFSTKSVKNNYESSDLWVRDGSYLRLKTMKIGYNFTKSKLLKQLGISQLSIFCSGYNLLTFDYLKVVDPESSPSTQDTYPINKIYNVGLNVSF